MLGYAHGNDETNDLTLAITTIYLELVTAVCPLANPTVFLWGLGQGPEMTMAEA